MNINTYFALAFVSAIGFVQSTFAQNSQHGFHRIAIVDISPSMNQAGKIETVKSELLGMVTQFPPTDDSPFTFVLFGDAVLPSKTFTDLNSTQAFIRKILANGNGTDIPKALVATADEIDKINNGVMAFLFSDMENGTSQDAMDAAMKRMNQLFRDRSKRQLSNVVVIQQWGNSSSLGANFQSLVDDGIVQLIEAKNLKFETVRITPEVRVVSSQRDTLDPAMVHVKLELAATLTPKVTKSIPVTCSLNRDKGFQFDLVCGKTKHVELQLNSTQNEEGRQLIELQFDFQISSDWQSKNQLTICQLAPTQVDVDVPLIQPKYVRQTVVSVKPTSKPPVWHNPAKMQAEYELEFEFDVRSLPIDRERSSFYEVTCLAPSRIVEGPAEVDIAPNSSKRFVYKVIVDSQDGTLDGFDVEFEIRPTKSPANVKHEKKLLTIPVVNLPAPSQLVTRFVPRQIQFKPGKWVSIQKRVARFEARVVLRAEGTVIPSDQFSVSDRQKSRFKIQSPNLSSRETIVLIQFLAGPSDFADGLADLELELKPPSPLLAVRYEIKQPIKFQVPEPPPLEMSIAVPRSAIQVNSDDTNASIPVSINLKNTKISSPAFVRLSADQRSVRSQVSKMKIGRNSTLDVEFDPLGRNSIFHDSIVGGYVSATPLSNQPLKETEAKIQIVAEAPFKRLIPYFCGAASILLVVVLFKFLFGTRVDTEGG